MKLDIQQTRFTPGEFEDASGNKKLFGFDFGPDLIHVLLCPSAPNGGAIAIWRNGSDFAARISLTDLAQFALQAEREHKQRKGQS